MKNLQLLSAIVLLTFSTRAQDVAMNTISNYENSYTTYNSTSVITPLIEETVYTYKYHGKNVKVVFTKNEHIEYFDNNKYFIKSAINWTSEDECYMTIKESNLPDFPFRRGTKLNMKITKIKRGYIFYESTLGGRTWEGKMKKI